MRSGQLLTQLALCASSVHAFYPFTPKWLKQLEEKRGLESRDHAVERDTHGSSRIRSAPLRRSTNKYSVMKADNPSSSTSAGIDQDGTDYSYFVEVKLGSKSKSMYMLLDTGAGSSWVMGSGCKSDACGLHNSFGSDDSSTYKDSGEDFSVAYGSGDVKGDLFTDRLCLGGSDDAAMCFDYEMGAATETSDDFEHFAFDGILGLAMDSGSGDNLLDTIDGADDIDVNSNVFGISLHRASDGDDNDGAITFGGADKTRYTGDITYVDVDDGSSSWAIALDDVSYDGTKSGAGGVSAYIDTGTTFVFGPSELVKAVHAVIPDASSDDNGVTYSVPCDTETPLTFVFGGVGFDVSPKDWVSPKDSDGVCTSNIYGQEAVKGAWLLGDTFIKNVYAVFDKDKKRIGFAERSDGAETASSSQTITPAPATATTGSLAPSATASATGSDDQATGGSSSSNAQSTGSSDSGKPDSGAAALGLSKLAFFVGIASALCL